MPEEENLYQPPNADLTGGSLDNSDFDQASGSEIIELSRSRNGDTIQDIKEILNEAKIPCRVGSTATNFDITEIGMRRDPELIISVRRLDFSAAREAMEEEYLKIELPSDHYLLSSSDEEIAEILGQSTEWGPFDVAHARKLAEERGIDPIEIQKKKDERMDKLRQGKPVSRVLILLGWLFSVLGGIVGIGIAWSICYMKEKTPEGDFYTYDERSRELGKPMFKLACVVTALVLFLKFSGAFFVLDAF